MSRLPGKKIDTWEWSKDKQTIKVDVRMDPKHHDGGTHFGVIVPELDINLWHRDINTLRELVFAELERKVSIEWKPFLYVRVTGDTELLRETPGEDDDDQNFDGLTPQQVREQNPKSQEVRFQLTVDVSSYELASSPTGQRLSRRVEEWRNLRQASEGWPETGRKANEPDRYDLDTELEVKALIPDTPANRIALNSLATELQKLIDRIVEVCDPDTIQQTLAAAAGRKLLTEYKEWEPEEVQS